MSMQGSKGSHRLTARVLGFMAAAIVVVGCTWNVDDLSARNEGVRGKASPKPGAARPDTGQTAGSKAPPSPGGDSKDPDCVCTAEYAPVCGADGVTYSNACRAHCADVAIEHEGECEAPEEPCICTREYNPVCGEDGVTYGNPCMARCADAVVAHSGECGDVACDYDAPGRDWVLRDGGACMAALYACPEGQVHFGAGDCGCGCEEVRASSCQVGGCSGQLCTERGDDAVTTCEWREEYACYRSATCTVQPDGRCGWTPTDALERCIADARAGSQF